jgi:3-dehydroquinate dehydratase/shikimate dehydrogenase
MFVQQGARQFEIWTGKPAPLLEMQRIVDFALAQRAAAKSSSNETSKGKKVSKLA